MTDTPIPYTQLSRAERQISESPIIEGIFALRRLLPLGRARFDALLARAMDEAARHRNGFHLGGFAARRALGRGLIFDVDPSVLEQRLDHRVKQDARIFNIRDKCLGAGDWTPLLRFIGRSTTHREVTEIVAAGFDYRAARSYHKAMDRSLGPKPVKRNFVALSSPARVESYFRQTAELCRSIHKHGIVRRNDYGWRMERLGTGSVRLPWVELGEVDIGVAIGPAGQIYRFASGKHRTAAAQALGLKSIPVEVRMIHSDWLARQMDETGLSPSEALVHGIAQLTLPRR